MSFSPGYIIVIMIFGVLFFGRNLPGVARQLGASLIEFRKGLNDWKEVHSCSSGVREGGTEVLQQESEERFEALGTKFEPPS